MVLIKLIWGKKKTKTKLFKLIWYLLNIIFFRILKPLLPLFF